MKISLMLSHVATAAIDIIDVIHVDVILMIYNRILIERGDLKCIYTA